MDRNRTILLTLLEVFAVFVITKALMQAVTALIDHGWQIALLGVPFKHYLAALAVILFVIILRRRKGKEDGLMVKPFFYHAEAAASCFVPVAAVAIALTLTDWKTWPGALLIAAIALAATLLCALSLKKLAPENPKKALSLVILGAGLILSIAIVARMTSPGDAARSFIFAFLLAGPIEEMIFRGYAQSRLNQVFDRRFTLMGISFGWGLILTAVLFSLWHLPLPFVFADGLECSLPHAAWTFCAGLLLGAVREKTGSIAAPTILHGFLNFL